MSREQEELELLFKQNRMVLIRQKKHKVYQHPSGAIFVTPKTPSDEWAWKNALAGLRRFLRRVDVDS